MAKALLRNPDLQSVDDELKSFLGTDFFLYQDFVKQTETEGILTNWKFYTDTKSWLAKGIYHWTGPRGGKKTKTMFWLSLWDNGLKITIYLPNKARSRAATLPLPEGFLSQIQETAQVNKLKFFPLIFLINEKTDFKAIFELIRLKKDL